MRFLIMGAGSIGSVIGGFLYKGNHEVYLLGLGQHIDAVLENGLKITGIWGDHMISGIQAGTSLDEMKKSGFDPEWILFSVKSYDTEAALSDLGPALKNSRGVITLQNGLGNVEAIERKAPGKAVGGRVIFGAKTSVPGTVEVTVIADDVLLGPAYGGPDGVEAVCEAFSRSGIPCRYEKQITTYIWDKVLYNVCLNPLATLLRCSYGELGDDPETRTLIEQLVHEFYEVAAAEGVSLVSETPADYIERFFTELLPPTRDHRSSMQEDIERGSRTEIDALSGAVWNLGKKHGTSTPVNETLTRLIHHLETGV
ncbi:MAG: ketopantoate reductase family protein [Actinobacteria bacterium]|nr:ketopantoate reductase family protein [Actinomycetota bacterium]